MLPFFSLLGHLNFMKQRLKFRHMGSQGFGCALTCDQAFFFEREASKYKRGGYDCRLDVA